MPITRFVNDQVNAILASGHGVIRPADHPSRRATIGRLAEAGALRRVFPGTYIRAEDHGDRQVRLAAACAWAAPACLWGQSALEAASGDRRPFQGERIRLVGQPRPHPAVHWYRARLPEDFVVTAHGCRYASPLVVAVDAAAHDRGASLDRLLRIEPSLAADLPLVLSWFSTRSGNRQRTAVVLAAAKNPWSAAERELHRLLDRSGITGWIANPVLRTRFGVFIPDLLLEAHRLVIEVDGREFHTAALAFEADRLRQNRLVLLGYRVLRFTWRMLTERPREVLATIRAALAR